MDVMVTLDTSNADDTGIGAVSALECDEGSEVSISLDTG